MEEEKEERQRVFMPYQVNKELFLLAKPDAIFMHCLPAVKEQEVTEEVFESTASRIWDEAENRKHTIKAIMLGIM